MFSDVIKQLLKLFLFGLVSNLFLSMPLMAGWNLEWIENFDGSQVNRSNWTSQVQANYNAEVQCYTDDDTSVNKNYDVSNGTLKIIAKKEANSCAGLGGAQKSWTSGRLNSKDKREFLYGRIEARIRFNDLRRGSWPAFWMIENRINEHPKRGDNDFVGWPNPGAGEIDVWEWHSSGPNSYITNFFNTSNCGSEVRYSYPGGAADVLQWHDYAIEWEQNSIRFFIDEVMVASHNITNCAQYKEPMFVLLNVAMGGTLGGSIDPALTTTTMEVDYVAHCSASTSNNLTRCNPSNPSGTTPIITSNPSRAIASDSFYSYTLIATDADGDNLTLTATVKPEWLAFNSKNGVLSGIPSNADVGNHPVTLTVNDGSNLINQTFNILVSAPVAPTPVNNVPTLSISTNFQAQVGVRYQNTIVTSDLDNDSLILSATVLPDWLVLDASTGLLSGTPVEGDIGNHNVRLRVSDGMDIVTQTIVINVKESTITIVTLSNTDPIITSNPINNATVGQSYSYTLISSDEDGDELQLSATKLPDWLTFNSENSTIQGIPKANDIGTHEVVMTVRDGISSASQRFDIKVIAAATVNSSSEETPPASSGGGSLDFILLMLMAFGLISRMSATLKHKSAQPSIYEILKHRNNLLKADTFSCVKKKQHKRWGDVIFFKINSFSLVKPL